MQQIEHIECTCDACERLRAAKLNRVVQVKVNESLLERSKRAAKVRKMRLSAFGRFALERETNAVLGDADANVA